MGQPRKALFCQSHTTPKLGGCDRRRTCVRALAPYSSRKKFASSPRNLIRRVTLDLTGLPPTPRRSPRIPQRPTSRRLRVFDRPSAALPSLWRALGTPLARHGGYSEDFGQGVLGDGTVLRPPLPQPQANNPLTTRVMVNRIWQSLFGQSIVGYSDAGPPFQPPPGDTASEGKMRSSGIARAD